MFIQVSLLFLIILIIYLITKNIIISNHKLYLDKSKIKYNVHDSDKRYLEKYSIDSFLSNIKENDIFYTTKKWSTKNNNYFKFNETYYIIEPGYYYYYVPEAELFLELNCKIKLINQK